MYLLEDVEQFVKGKYPNAIDIQSLAKGGHAHAFCFSYNGNNYVIRFSPHSEDFAKDKFIAQFNSLKLPIPKVFQTGKAFDGYFCVTEKATGIMLDDLNTEQIRLTIPSILDTLDAMRLIDLSATTGYGSLQADGNGRCSTWQQHLLDSLDDNEQRRVYGWSDKLKNSKYGIDLFNQGLEIFKELIKKLPADRHILHFDLLNQNVLVNDNKITAVFDWGCAMYGDPIFELAGFTYWAPLLDGYREFDWKSIFKKHFQEIGIDIPNFDERLLAYELFIGLDSLIYNAHLERWDSYEQSQDLVLKIIELLDPPSITLNS